MDQAKACQHSISPCTPYPLRPTSTPTPCTYPSPTPCTYSASRIALVYVLRARDGLYYARIPIIRAYSERLPYASSSPSTTRTGYAAPRARNYSSLLSLGVAFVLYCVLYHLPSPFLLGLVCERAESLIALLFSLRMSPFLFIIFDLGL
ncbi:hypothetical protein K523DRAFT_90037 [Schizophyllum commune Tattone D]|nr:hypothetical protein K523DRAFT_90037 [Schizophyllum commune Tattone D]